MSARMKTTKAALALLVATAVTTQAMAEDLRITNFEFGVDFQPFAPKADRPDKGGGGSGGGGGGGKGGGKPDKGDGGTGSGSGGGGNTTFPYYGWMHPDTEVAWGLGFTGAGSTITIIDNYDPTTASLVDLDLDMDGYIETMAHGNAVRAFSQFVSPEANLVRQQYDHTGLPVLTSDFDIINLSFGLATESGLYEEDWLQTGGHVLEAELIRLAFVDTYAAGAEDAPVIVKAAGNGGYLGQGGVIGEFVGAEIPFSGLEFGFTDVLGHDLIGGSNVIFAGALDANGSIDPSTGRGTGTLAVYSDHPGDNVLTQAQTLVVGVDSSQMVAAGTSFAAPIVSSYAAIVADKFSDESSGAQPHAGLVVDRLLDTARTDTILNYDPYYHGQGEASLSRAIAPDWISGN